MIKRFSKYAFTQSSIIPWMMIVAIIPMLFVSILAYDFAVKSLRSTISNTLNTAIDKKVEIIADYINDRKLYLMQISELPNLSETITKAGKGEGIKIADEAMLPLKNYFDHFSRIFGIENIYVADLNGLIIYNLHAEPVLGQTLSAVDMSHNELYKAFEGAKVMLMPFVLSSFYKKEDSNKAYIYLSNPINDSQNFLKGILIMRLNPKEIANAVNRYLGYSQSEETILATLHDNKPLIVMHTQHSNDILEDIHNLQLDSILVNAAHGESLEPTEIKLSGKKYIAVSRYIPQLNMGILILYDKYEVYQKVIWLRTNMLVSISIGLLIVALIAYWISSKLRAANLKSEKLLQNIFPDFVIEELKEKKHFAARNVANVSVMFVDIVNFTEFSANKDPEAIVRFLDEIFSIFDKLTSKYNLEKVKTIGDAYMAASGLTESQEDHADLAVNLGLEMILALKHYNLDNNSNFTIRAGIDSGTITTGIIGKNKFSYDLWGDVVNRASRMETTGLENQVQITARTHAALLHKENYLMNYRENVSVKGLGTMDTFMITGLAKFSET